MRRVVVTGMGAITPLGRTLEASWEALIAKKCGATTLENALKEQNLSRELLERELQVAATLPCGVAAPVSGVNQDNRTARFVELALIAGTEAMQKSGLLTYLEKTNQNHRVGVCVGSGMSGVREVVEAARTIEEKGQRRISPHFVPKVLSNSASGRLSLEFLLTGPNHSASTACAAGAHAIGDAMRCIQYGNADIMLAGGSEACIDPLSMAGFCRLRALSTNRDPELASRPFDKKRDGFIMGEGSAVLILEELEHAVKRGAPILAEIIGYGLTGDAHHITSPDPDGLGAQRAMQMALESADIEGSEIGYVNAHATSTPIGDAIEARAISNALGSSSSSLFVSSTKGATGHLLGAAGAVEAAFTVKSLEDKVLPATRNLEEVEPTEQDTTFEHVYETTPCPEILIAMTNSFGFGGTNASLVFKAYDK